jgi:nicotinate-nucleotide adenylyltransferase
MGSDNLDNIHKWKNYDVLIDRYAIHIYSRKGSAMESPGPEKGDIRRYDVPMVDISSTYIRHCIAAGHSIRYMVPESVFQYLDGSRLYRQ